MISEEKKIHLAIAFDYNYLKPFYVLLTSIFRNNQSAEISIYAITSSISEREKERIRLYVSTNGAKIFFYEIDSALLKNFTVPKDAYISIAAYFRIFFPLIVPREIEKIIYLDTDTLVVGNLIELYEINAGNPVSAVVDSQMAVRSDLGLESKEEYFN